MDRRLGEGDYYLVKHVLERTLKRLLRSKAKTWYKYISIQRCLDYFFSHPNAYIVDDAYLAIYEIVQPFYAEEGITILEEVIVIRLSRGTDFSAIPAFFERKREEAGATMSAVGTALARNDKALASMYEQYGYRTETLLMVKD